VPGRDIKIEFTGTRPGEKLFEELYLDSECIEPTAHPQVFRLRSGTSRETDPALLLCLERLGDAEGKDDPLLEQGRLRLNQLIGAQES